MYQSPIPGRTFRRADWKVNEEAKYCRQTLHCFSQLVDALRGAGNKYKIEGCR
jgi:hypothetical protein